MANKKVYSPVRVVNPTSFMHVVRLKAGQLLELKLDEQRFPNAELECYTQHLGVVSEFLEGDCHVFRLGQSLEVARWSDYSNVLLGEVWIASNSDSARLLVMLDCNRSAKSQFVSVINPDRGDLRLKPSDVLEVILYNLESDHDWDWTWTTELATDLVLLGSDSLNLYAWPQWFDKTPHACPERFYACYPRAYSHQKMRCRQHHFWFRFGSAILPLMSSMGKVVEAGALRFVPKDGDGSKSHDLHLHVELDAKHRTKMMSTLMLPHKAPHEAFQLMVHNPQNIVRRKVQPPKPAVLMINDVNLEPLQSSSLAEGCRTISALPPLPHNFPDYESEYYDGYGFCGNTCIGPRGSGFGRVPYGFYE